MPTPSTVFISYSHKDEVWKDRLVTHLKVLGHQLLLDPWDDRNIKGGDEWEKKIREAMAAAEVALLLISQNFLTSKFILETEVPYLLERRESGEITVLPVICESCHWKHIPWLAKLQVRPRDGKALASFRGNTRNDAFVGIGEEILEAINGAKPSSRPPSPAGALLAALHQLPSPPADFTGRKEDLEALRSAVPKSGSLAIFGLRGTGGVGKTTLALKLAEELTPQYPDAQIYLDLKGVDPQPLTTVQAMAHVVRSFMPDARLPEGEMEMANVYRSVLHGKRVLLLMDNASGEGRSQTEPLIPPAGSLLLVTSRFHFVLPGMVSRDLDKLSENDARDLLLSIAPRINGEAAEIAKLCGCLPLALRLAGSVLAERRDLSPLDYIRRLQEGKERLDKVEVSLDLSYQLLAEDSRRLWRMLGVFPGTFNAEAAAAVWDLEPDSARDRLSELVGRSLVEWEGQEGRYRLHDLAREFTWERLVDSEKDLAARRHAKYFAGVLRRTDELYLEGGEKILKGLRMSDTEWGNIQAGQAWAASKFQEDEEAANLCSLYPNAGYYFLEIRQNPRERIHWAEAALEAARRIKDKAEGLHLASLGSAYKDLGDPRRAIEFSEQHLALAREISNRYEEGRALGNLGIAYRDLGDPRRAIELHEQDLAIAREIGDRRGEGITLGNLGVAYKDLGEFRRAIEFYEQHIAIAHEVGDRRGEGSANWNLGLIFEEEGDLTRAVDLMQVLVDYEREIGHSDAEKDAARVETIRARLAAQNAKPKRSKK